MYIYIYIQNEEKLPGGESAQFKCEERNINMIQKGRVF